MTDPILKSKASLSKSEWISLNDAVEQWLEVLQFPDPQGTLPSELASLLNSSFSDAMRVPEFSMKGVQVDGKTNLPTGALVDIPSLHFRVWRTFRPQHNLIEPYHDEHSKDVAFQALHKSPRHPEWVDVQVHRLSFEKWLRHWFRNYLFDEIAHGELLPDEGKKRLADLGFEPLYREPNVNDFHPEKEVYWSLSMSVAWISWRDMTSVIRSWENYTRHLKYWRSSKGPHQIKLGAVLEDCGDPTLFNLILEESLGIFRKDSPPQLLTIKFAREELWKKLQAGDLVAVGKQQFDSRVAMDAHLWLDLSVQQVGPRREVLGEAGDISGRNSWNEVKLRSADVLRIWPNPIVDETQELGLLENGASQKGHKQSAVSQALDALFPEGKPTLGLSAKERDIKVRAWIKGKGLSAPASDGALSKAIQRELTARK
jgi:hypothetical protein